MHTGPIASHMTPPGINLKWQTPIRQGNRSRSRSRSVQHPSMEDKPNHPPKSHSFSGDPPCASFVTFIIHFIYSFFFFFFCTVALSVFDLNGFGYPALTLCPSPGRKLNFSLRFCAGHKNISCTYDTHPANHPLKTSQTSPFLGNDFSGLGPSPVFIAVLLHIGFIFSYSAVSVSFLFSIQYICGRGRKSCSRMLQGLMLPLGSVLLLSRFSHIS